ncbi:MAG: serine hydrolase domain-containing protein [Kofleriaceae bacterium]
MSTLRWVAIAAVIGGCSAPARGPAPPKIDLETNGPHKEQVAAVVRPYLEGEVLSGVVVGLYSAGKREFYGFGAGPGGAPPNADSLFEIGPITSVYTGILLADAVQRREVELDTALAELVPAGVTVPTQDKVAITLRHLALHSAGLPATPPSLFGRTQRTDPYAAYDEDALYRDLNHTQLDAPPGTQISYSSYGVGVLGVVLGKKIGGGFREALEKRVLAPLGMRDTYFVPPPSAAARRVGGTNDDLRSVPHWSWNALASAGALISSARDQIQLVDVELDAAAGGTTTLRAPIRLTQESQIEDSADNAGLGWQIDRSGRYWHAGGTGGFRSFVGFDPKSKRGVVVLASTASAQIDRLGRVLFAVLDGDDAVKPASLPTADQLASYLGTYDLGGTQLAVVGEGKRIYLEGPGEPRHRMSPLSGHEFWIEALQAVAFFQRDSESDPRPTRVVFNLGGRQLIAPRAESGAAAPAKP